ncbi:twin-arginine translocation signal domain-containing protein [Klebsiella pneumoniae]|nr:twin-arginine translocation signal domain-containing protein [Klebsiella pneumoniae]MCQ0593636.1 twin-arginine translocation signal domain-containing protein [Klebsiella pneumoniae]
MKEPNKIDGNRRDLLKGLGIAAALLNKSDFG